jgi:hypothetical protein
VDAVASETVRETEIRFDERRFRVVTIVAVIAALPFAASHLTIALALVPALENMFLSMGGQLPGPTQFAISLSHHGVLAVLLILVDGGVFVLMYKLARRYWIGLLFAPIALYLGIGAALVPVLYWPMFQVINLVR